MVSSFGMKDGIEAYTEELCNALRRYGLNIVKCPLTKGLSYLISKVKKEEIDIIHIQHEYGLFKPKPFGMTAIVYLALLRLLGKKVVITLHTVYPIREFENYIPSRYQTYPFIAKYLAKLGFLVVTKILAKLSQHIIVLTPKGKRVLETEYGIHNVSFIPYGIHKSKVYEHEYAKARIGFSNKIVLACFGYPYPNKGFQYAIEAVNKLVEIGYRNVVLLLQDIKLAHDYRKCEEYINMLKDLVRRKKLETYVHFLPFIPEKELPLYLSAVDIFIYPYEHRVASSSALMRTLYFGKWYILTDIPAFEIFKNLGLSNIKFVKPRSPDEIAEAILKIVSERRGLNTNKELLDKFSWENIGKMHIELYKLIRD